MQPAGDPTPTTTPDVVDRRAALRKLAVGGGLVAGSVIVSRPAFADSGSTACRYNFAANPTLGYTYVNSTGATPDQLRVEVTNVTGTCPCGSGTPAFEYQFRIAASPSGFNTSTGWISTPFIAIPGQALWPDAGGSFDFSGGIRVTCPGSETVPAIRCRFGGGSVSVGAAPTGIQTGGVPMSATSPTAGLVSCDFGL